MIKAKQKTKVVCESKEQANEKLEEFKEVLGKVADNGMTMIYKKHKIVIHVETYDEATETEIKSKFIIKWEA